MFSLGHYDIEYPPPLHSEKHIYLSAACCLVSITIEREKYTRVLFIIKGRL